MNDTIEQLLKRADAAAVAPKAVLPGLAQRVRIRVRNQRRFRQALVAMLFVGAIVTLATWRRNGPAQPLAAAKLSDDLAQLDLEANYHQLVAAKIQKHERDVAAPAALEADEYLRQLAEENNRSALILIGEGDRFRREFHDVAAAEADYQEAIRLFPQVPAAATAEQRLQNLINDKGSES